MKRYLLKYWDLGRENAKGERIVHSNVEIVKEFSKHLRSSDISFNEPNIYAGFYSVGKFSLTKMSKHGDLKDD